jgi:glycosyltransferase involved in cell wall biosynthesis
VTRPAVSVLLPCYNAEANLDEALESLARQTIEEIEVIAVDDGSVDSTPAILARWAGFDSRIRVIRQDHAGIIEALNRGMAACSAPYIARMDHDDRCHSQRLFLQKGYLDAHPEVAVAGCLVRATPFGQVREGLRIYLDWLNSLVEGEDIRREIFIESPLVHPSVMFRAEVVRAVGGYQERGWPEDYDLWLRLYLNGVRFGKVPQVLLEWREHPHRLTRLDSRYSLENFLRLKAHYLTQGPLASRQSIFVWGAGMTGRRLVKQLERLEVPLVAFIDVDPAKIGRRRRGLPVLAPDELPERWGNSPKPALLAAVGARRARPLIRQHIRSMGLEEGSDWWFAA